MNIYEINPRGTYQISGADFLAAIAAAVRQTIMELREEPLDDKWAGKRKLSHNEAAEYLGVKPKTLHGWKTIYNIEYEPGKPCYYRIEELRRVERERLVVRYGGR